MQKPVAVTGATGFVGGHLLDKLLAEGHQVRVLVRDRSKFKRKSDQLEIIEGDLDNRSVLTTLISGVGAVIHCAGAIAALDRDGFFKVNQTGAENMARAAADTGIKRFVLVSSLAARQPQLSSYGASKLAGEKAVAGIIAPDRLVIVRPPAVYGPGDRATLPLIRALTQKRAILPGRKDQKISLLYVKDLAGLLAALADNSSLCGSLCGSRKGHVLEVDDGRSGGYSFGDIAELAGKAQGRDIALTLLPRAVVAVAGFGAGLVSRLLRRAMVLSPEKVAELYHPDWVAKGTKIKGWQPRVQFQEGFDLALSWYQANGWLPGGRARVKSQTNSNHGDTVK